MGLVIGIGNSNRNAVKYYGVEKLRQVADPAFGTLLGDATLHSTLPLHNQIRPCKVNESRQIVNYLNATDWTKNADGTTSVLDGSDGLDVMIDNPQCWIIAGGTNAVYERWIVANAPFSYDGDVAMEIKRFVDSPDYCTINRVTGKSRSVRNETADFAGSGSLSTAGGLGYPRTATSRYGYETAAAAKGSGWEGLSYVDLVYVTCMMYIEYRTKNLKTALGSGASNWTSAEWSAYNGYNPVFKMFEAQLALSGTTGIVSQGYMSGVHSKTFTSPARITPLPVWRGRNILWGNLWAWRSRIEMEVQSVAAGGKSYLYVGYPPVVADANRSDASFAFKTAYTLIGEVPQVEAWVKTMHNKTVAGNVLSGAAETTYGCAYNWNTNLPASGTVRRGVLFGAPLYDGGDCALGSASALYAPSHTYAYFGGGFRADVAG